MIKNQIYYIICLVFIAVVALNMKDRYTMALFFTFISLPILSLLVTAVSFKKLNVIHSRMDPSVQKNTKTKLGLSIENYSLCFFPYVRIICKRHRGVKYEPSPDMIFSVNPRTLVSADFNVKYNFRGNYNTGCETLEVYDFLKIFRLKKKITDVPSVFVCPRIHNILLPGEILERNENEYSVMRAGESDNSDVIDFREYQESDNMKRIHWKLSSKSEELIVKKYASFEKTDALIAVDLKKIGAGCDETYIKEDSIIETAVSIINHYIKQGKTINFLYADDNIRLEKLNTPQGFNKVFHICATLRFSSKIPFNYLISQYIEKNQERFVVFLLTASVDSEFIELVKRSVMSGYQMVVIDFGEQSEDKKDYSRLFEEIHAQYYRPEEVC